MILAVVLLSESASELTVLSFKVILPLFFAKTPELLFPLTVIFPLTSTVSVPTIFPVVFVSPWSSLFPAKTGLVATSV